jgi:hypothetical protein
MDDHMAEKDEDRIFTLDQLPDDPLKMPPPYWRGCGAIFHVEDALEEIEYLLHDLIPLHAETETRLAEHYEKYPEHNEDDEEALEEFSEITDDLAVHEHRIRLKAEVACLMSAIEAEDEINRFCVYNLHRDIAESIEKLSPPEKLLIASAAIGKPGVKGDSVFEAARRLAGWRNAFAHGHCIDRPTKSLRHNHLIPPDEYPGVPSSLAEMRELIGAYLRVSDYLSAISINPYTASKCSNVENVQDLLTRISKYRFDGNNYVYDVILDKKEQKRIANALVQIATSGDESRRTQLENILTTLDPFRERILLLELGLTDGRPRSRTEIMAIMELSASELSRKRAIALTHLAGVEHLLLVATA